MWHKYVQFAVINYDTTYHETLGCEPSTVFHGQIPYNVLDSKIGTKTKLKTTPNSDKTDQLQMQIVKVLLYSQPGSRQSIIKICVSILRLDGTVYSYKTLIKQ